MQASPEPQARHFIGRRLGVVVRLARTVILLLGLGLAGLAIFLALPPGKALVLRTVSASLADHLGVEVRAGALDYRPGSLGITVHGLTLRHVTAARPFLSAERVEIDFSPAVLRGNLVVRRLDVSGPAVVLDPATRPASASDPRMESRALASPTISSLVIHGGSVRDLTLTSTSLDGTRIAVQGLSLSFTGEGPGRARGTVTVAGGGSVRRGSAEVIFDRARADVSLAGTSVALTSIRIDSPVAAIDGAAAVDISSGDVAVKYHARVAAGELQAWLTELPPLEGEVEVTGTVSGTVERPIATFDARTERLHWREFTDIRAAVVGRWSGADLAIERYEASSRAFGAHLQGRAHLVVGGHQGLSSVRAEASLADARILARLNGPSALPDAAVMLTGDLSWPGLRPAVDGLSGRVQMKLLNAAAPRLPIVTADASGERGRWSVRTLGALDGGTSLSADISVILDPTHPAHSIVAGRLGMRSDDLEVVERELRRHALLSPNVHSVLQGGRAAAEGTLTGTLASPRLEARLTASSLTIAGVEQVRAEAQVRIERGAIEITRMTAEAPGNRVDVHGTATPGEGLVHLEIAALINEPSRLAAALPAEWRPTGSLAVTGTLDGTLLEPRLVARISGRDLAAHGIVADSLETDVAFADKILQMNGHLDGPALGSVEWTATGADRAVRFEVRLPAIGADVSGGFGMVPGRPFEARANLRRSTLTSLAALAGKAIDLPGTSVALTATADIAGELDHPWRSTAVIAIPEIAGEVRGMPVRLLQPGQLRVDGPRLTVERPLSGTVGRVSVALERIGEHDHGALLTLEGRIEEALALLPPGTSVNAWSAEGSVRGRVSLDQDNGRLRITGHANATLDRLLRGEGEIARAVGLEASINERAIAFSATGGDLLGSPFDATGRAPLAWALPAWLNAWMRPPGDEPIEAVLSARADARIGPALEALGIRNTKVSGTATIAVEGRAAAPRLDDVVATVTVEAAEISVEELGLSQQVPTRLRFDRGMLEVQALQWKGPQAFLTASGALGVLPGHAGELQADGATSLAFLRMLVPGIGGDAGFRLRVSGPPGARAASARIDLQGVNVIERGWQLALSDVSGSLTLENGVLETGGLRGQLNGGDLRIEGAVPVRAGVVAPRPLTVDARGLFVEIPKGLRSQLDTRLTWEQAGAGPRLSGEVTIASDRYREPITALASTISAAMADGAKPRPVPSWIAATALDIRVSAVGPIVVEQSVLNLELLPDLRLTGTVGRPGLDGRVSIQDDGRIRVGGRSYRLTESRLEFSPAAGLLPRLNLIGETQVSSYLVTLRMVGPADQIETNFSSDPPLSERDVRSLLVSGQIADPARRTNDSDTFAVAAVSGGMLGVAGQFVGLDAVSVGTEDIDLVSSDVDPATRLTVSKRLGTRFELLLSENLDENESTWIVVYRPFSGYEFRLSSKENTREALEFRQEIRFGPGASAPRRVRTSSVARDRIRAVSITGEPGFSAAELLAGTKLKAGDRFDFQTWLEDRDRILQHFWERNYYTARVVPTRTPVESTGRTRTVDLQYRVTRGRRTALDVTGYAGRDLPARLREAWSANVLLDLLDDRLARAARDHLIDDGYLRAKIEVAIDRPDSDTDRARVRIDPGPRTVSRQLAFVGNQVLTTETLQALAQSGQMSATVWKDPAELIVALRAAYAAKGHLAAEVTIGAVEFADHTATLPVRIVEGRAARVSGVELTGVAAERRAGALEAIALTAGSPFNAGDERAGRARLERYYRDRGFREVQVEATIPASAGTELTLAFAVTEGPLHVVRSVQVEGVYSTRPSLVTKAVQVTAGQPAGAAAAAATEKQLYGLGTFRRADVRFEPAPVLPGDEAVRPVLAIVSLEEARRYQLRYGLELSSEYTSALDQRTNALGVAADIRDRNFLGRGMSLGGGLRYEPGLRSARALFSTPTLRGRPIRTNLFLNARGEEQRDEQVTAQDDEFNLTIEQRWRVSRAIEYSWGYSSEWRSARLASAGVQETLDFNGILASLNGAMVIDRRDSVFDAKRGWFGSVSLQWGQQPLGSDVDYLRSLIRGSYYQPLGPVVLAGNVRWGRLATFGGTVPLTIFDLFFNAGGTESVRGYSQDELSAYTFFDAPLGGTTLVVANAELRAPLFWRFGGVLFADAGNTFARAQTVRLSDLGVGLGFGLRVITPLAPIRIDLGFPRSFGKTGARWHFSIGQMF